MNKESQENSLLIVKAFIAALEEKNITALAAQLTENASLAIPLSPSGDPHPWYLFDGKKKVMEYLQGACVMFSQLLWVDPVYTVSADAKRVFMEAHGNLIKADRQVPYENVYVYRFDLDGDKINVIAEYANPVTFSKLMNLSVG